MLRTFCFLDQSPLWEDWHCGSPKPQTFWEEEATMWTSAFAWPLCNCGRYPSVGSNDASHVPGSPLVAPALQRVGKNRRQPSVI